MSRRARRPKSPSWPPWWNRRRRNCIRLVSASCPSGYRPPGSSWAPHATVPLLLDDLEKDGDPTTAVMHVGEEDDRTVALLRERGYVGMAAAGDSVLEIDPE